ncbi:glutathione S-transferase N-terminal domain-containing protein [Mesorhizobium sp. M0622]|uniref:glutathione S-transferase family protein n=1 Tax=Mesorhizobium sp. M0622 TaxID=2956975 RepID=UPI003335F78C
MLLHSYLSSPFARKVRMALILLNLADRVVTRKPDLDDPNDPVRQANPLNKVPVLVRDDGIPVLDSPIILEYLDHLAGGGIIFPREPEARFRAVTLEALCDGALDACLIIRNETIFRPEKFHFAASIEHEAGKVERALDAIEADPPWVSAMPDVGQITLACLLGYRDFRFDGSWRDKHPRLHAWHDAFAAAVPAFVATAPRDE